MPPPSRFDFDWPRISRWCLLGTFVMLLWLLAPVAKCSWGAFRDTPIGAVEEPPEDITAPGQADKERVAEGTDLSTSFLSLVENGRSDISTGRLFRVARFLGVGLGELLDTVPLGEVTVVRAADRGPGIALAEGVRMFPVVGDADDVTMAPVFCEYEAGAIVAGGTRSETAQHLVLVLRGEIEITQRGEEPLLLEEP